MHIREKLRLRFQEFWTIVKYNLKIEMRYPISYLAAVLNMLFWLLAFVTLILLFAGNETNNIVPNLVAWGLASFILFNGFMSEVGFGIIRLQRRGTLEQILVTPISMFVLPLGLAGYNLVISLMFIILVVVLVNILSGSSIIIKNLLPSTLAFILMLIMFYGAALILAALSIRLKRSSWALVNAITMSYMIFCGAFYSFSMMPSQLLIISRLIPFSYALDLFRTTIVGIDPELIKFSIKLGSLVLSSRIIEWLIVGILSPALAIGGKMYLIKTIDKGRIDGSLGTY